MSKILSTDPSLSIPAPDPIGRLYRLPGSTPLQEREDGGVIVPESSQLFDQVLAGNYMPSVTNVIGLLDKPHLIPWASKLALEEMFEFAFSNEKNSEYLRRNKWRAIAYYRESSKRYVQAAAERGTRVHEAAEYLAMGKTLEDLGYKLTNDEMRCVDSFKKWMDEWQPEFLANELTVFGITTQGLPYAGTADFVAKINGNTVAGDYKTTRSGLHNEVSLQLTAIVRAQQCTLDSVTLQDNFVIDAAVGVHLSPEKYYVRQASTSESKWDTFCALRSAWNFAAFEGRTAAGDYSLGGQLASPADLKIVTTKKK